MGACAWFWYFLDWSVRSGSERVEAEDQDGAGLRQNALAAIMSP